MLALGRPCHRHVAAAEVALCRAAVRGRNSTGHGPPEAMVYPDNISNSFSTRPVHVNSRVRPDGSARSDVTLAQLQQRVPIHELRHAAIHPSFPLLDRKSFSSAAVLATKLNPARQYNIKDKTKWASSGLYSNLPQSRMFWVVIAKGGSKDDKTQGQGTEGSRSREMLARVEEEVLEALSAVREPCTDKGVVQLGLVQEMFVNIDGQSLRVTVCWAMLNTEVHTARWCNTVHYSHTKVIPLAQCSHCLSTCQTCSLVGVMLSICSTCAGR